MELIVVQIANKITALYGVRMLTALFMLFLLCSITKMYEFCRQHNIKIK
jgi:hypothetical protein